MKPREAPQKVKASPTVEEVGEAFLSDTKTRRKDATQKQYDFYLSAFSKAKGKAKAESITPKEVLTYTNRPKWSQAYRCVVIQTIEAMFKWAEEVGIISTNPVKAMKKPSMPSRGAKAVISLDTHKVDPIV